MPVLHTAPPRRTLSGFGNLLMGVISVIAMSIMVGWMINDGITDLIRDAENITPGKGHVTNMPVVTKEVGYTLPATTYGPADLFLADGGQLTITVMADERGEQKVIITPSEGLTIYGVRVDDQFYLQSRQQKGEPVVLTPAHGDLRAGTQLVISAAQR